MPNKKTEKNSVDGFAKLLSPRKIPPIPAISIDFVLNALIRNAMELNKKNIDIISVINNPENRINAG